MTDTSFSTRLVDQLVELGLAAKVAHTGGGCMAIEVVLEEFENGDTDSIFISDGDCALPDGVGGYVGRCIVDADPIEFLLSEVGPTTVTELVDAVLAAVRFKREPVDLASVIDRAKAEIVADVRAGRVSTTVKSFSELHDYVDANEYGGLCEDFDAYTADEANAVQDAVDAWIKMGALRPLPGA